MNAAKKRDRTKTASNRFYRCPGCGQEVDNEQADAVREHHAHVLHPRPPNLFFPVVPTARLAKRD